MTDASKGRWARPNLVGTLIPLGSSGFCEGKKPHVGPGWWIDFTDWGLVPVRSRVP